LYAHLLLREGRFADACRICNKALAENPDQMPFALLKADALASSNNIAEGIREFERILNVSADLAISRHAKANQAVLLFLAQKEKRAIDLLKECKSESKVDGTLQGKELEEHIVFHLALFLFAQGDNEEAAKLWSSHRALSVSHEALARARSSLAVLCRVRAVQSDNSKQRAILDVQALNVLLALPC
jgi:tetratricopeptide (TPR) repeat protein